MALTHERRSRLIPTWSRLQSCHTKPSPHFNKSYLQCHKSLTSRFRNILILSVISTILCLAGEVEAKSLSSRDIHELEENPGIEPVGVDTGEQIDGILLKEYQLLESEQRNPLKMWRNEKRGRNSNRRRRRQRRPHASLRSGRRFPRNINICVRDRTGHKSLVCQNCAKITRNIGAYDECCENNNNAYSWCKRIFDFTNPLG